MAYTAIALREKKGLSLSQQSSEQITQRFTQYENNSIKQISLFVAYAPLKNIIILILKKSTNNEICEPNSILRSNKHAQNKFNYYILRTHTVKA